MLRRFLHEFREFAQKGGAVDMAIGVVTGAAMGGIVNSLVKDIITPPLGILLGKMDLSAYFIVLKGGNGHHYATAAAAQAAGETTLNIGSFANAAISFALTMFAVFLFVRAANKLRGVRPPATKTCPYCKTTIHADATKCPNCCADI